LKVLGVVGSPRRKGNTAALVEKILEGAREAGIETERFYLGDMQLNPCKDCVVCKRTGECAQKDDMQLVYEAIKDANVLVLGTPIYFDHISAQTKIFIDRLRKAIWGVGFPKGAKAIVVITYEWDNPTGYDYVIDWLKERLRQYHKLETIATFKAENTTKNPVSGRRPLLREAFDLGRSLIGYCEK